MARAAHSLEHLSRDPEAARLAREREDSAKFYQIPLRPAWASTIHKAQGLSLNTALLDIRAARNPGQAYVGVSRVKTLEGLFLKDVPGGVFVSPAAIRFHEDLDHPPAPAPAECLY